MFLVCFFIIEKLLKYAGFFHNEANYEFFSTKYVFELFVKCFTLC